MQLNRGGHGRLARCILVLVAASIGCVAMVAAQVDTAWTYKTQFLIWNLGLAWLPFVFALVLYGGYRRGRGPLYVSGCGVLWLLFLPNAPYIATDVVHLRDSGVEMLWYDATMVACFAITGLLLGLGSLLLVQTVVTAARGPVWGWATGLCALALSSVGIYMGRFAEVNSWDVVVAPGRVVEPFVERLQESLIYPRFIAVTVVMTTLLVVAYVVLYRVVQPRLELAPQRLAQR